jgi:hypothetical protein
MQGEKLETQICSSCIYKLSGWWDVDKEPPCFTERTLSGDAKSLWMDYHRYDAHMVCLAIADKEITRNKESKKIHEKKTFIVHVVYDSMC